MPATWPPRTVIRSPLACAPWSRRCTAAGWARSPGSTKSAAGLRGPLVVAACVLGPNRLESLAALDDSKKLNEKERERLFPLIRRYALAYHVVFIPSVEVDRRGVHMANIEGMRRGWRTVGAARICAFRRIPGAGITDAVAAGDRWRRGGGVHRCGECAGEGES